MKQLARHIRTEVRLRSQHDEIFRETRRLRKEHKIAHRIGDSRVHEFKRMYKRQKDDLKKLLPQLDLHRQMIKDLRKQLGVEKTVEQKDVEKDWKWLVEELQPPSLELGVFDERDEPSR